MATPPVDKGEDLEPRDIATPELNARQPTPLAPVNVPVPVYRVYFTLAKRMFINCQVDFPPVDDHSDENCLRVTFQKEDKISPTLRMALFKRKHWTGGSNSEQPAVLGVPSSSLRFIAITKREVVFCCDPSGVKIVIFYNPKDRATQWRFFKGQIKHKMRKNMSDYDARQVVYPDDTTQLREYLAREGNGEIAAEENAHYDLKQDLAHHSHLLLRAPNNQLDAYKSKALDLLDSQVSYMNSSYYDALANWDNLVWASKDYCRPVTRAEVYVSTCNQWVACVDFDELKFEQVNLKLPLTWFDGQVERTINIHLKRDRVLFWKELRTTIYPLQYSLTIYFKDRYYCFRLTDPLEHAQLVTRFKKWRLIVNPTVSVYELTEPLSGPIAEPTDNRATNANMLLAQLSRQFMGQHSWLAIGCFMPPDFNQKERSPELIDKGKKKQQKVQKQMHIHKKMLHNKLVDLYANTYVLVSLKEPSNKVQALRRALLNTNFEAYKNFSPLIKTKPNALINRALYDAMIRFGHIADPDA